MRAPGVIRAMAKTRAGDPTNRHSVAEAPRSQGHRDVAGRGTPSMTLLALRRHLRAELLMSAFKADALDILTCLNRSAGGEPAAIPAHAGKRHQAPMSFSRYAGLTHRWACAPHPGTRRTECLY